MRSSKTFQQNFTSHHSHSMADPNQIIAHYSYSKFVISFDKLRKSNENLPFYPTLSLLLLPRDSSSIRNQDKSDCIKPQSRISSRELSVESIRKNPELYLIGKCKNDPIIRTNRLFISSLAKLLLLSSLLMMILSLWVGYWMPKNFAWYILHQGAIDNFPLHATLVINSILGFVATIALWLYLLTKNFKRSLFWTGLFCCTWATLTMIYSFGATILFEAELEESMVKEFMSVRENSILWVNSQKFLQCCGINSFHDWDFWKQRSTLKTAKIKLYPKSCCDLSLRKPCKYQTIQSEVYLSGCLDPEMDMLLSIAYSIFLLTILHFFFETFAIMAAAKVFMRQRLLRHEMYISLIEDASDSESNEEKSAAKIEYGKYSEQTIPSNDNGEAGFQIKRSSTL